MYALHLHVHTWWHPSVSNIHHAGTCWELPGLKVQLPWSRARTHKQDPVNTSELVGLWVAEREVKYWNNIKASHVSSFNAIPAGKESKDFASLPCGRRAFWHQRECSWRPTLCFFPAQPFLLWSKTFATACAAAGTAAKNEIILAESKSLPKPCYNVMVSRKWQSEERHCQFGEKILGIPLLQFLPPRGMKAGSHQDNYTWLQYLGHWHSWKSKQGSSSLFGLHLDFCNNWWKDELITRHLMRMEIK